MPLLSLTSIQYLLAIVGASIVRKITLSYFFLNCLAWFKFEAFEIPTNDEIKQVVGTPTKKGKDKTKSRKDDKYHVKRSPSSVETFKISSMNIERIQLKKKIIQVRDIELMKYSSDLEWVMDLAMVSLFCLIITEIQFYFCPPKTEYNLSSLWALLIIIYCLKILWSVTAIYFRSEHSIGERSICIASGCIFFVIAMVTLTTTHNYLELGLNESELFSPNDETIEIDFNSSPKKIVPMSRIMLKLAIAVICASASVVLTFPGLRFGQLQQALVNQPENSNISQILYSANYISYLVVICLWIKPLRDRLKDQDLFPIDDAKFEMIRMSVVIFVNLLRFSLMPKYVAIFLISTVTNRFQRLKYGGGTTTNREIQILIASIYNYFNVIVIQYTLPVMLCFYSSILFILISYHKWSSSPRINEDPSTVLATGQSEIGSDSFLNRLIGLEFDQSELMAYLEGFRRLISAEVLNSIFKFSTWWLHFTYLCTCTVGLTYHRYFTH